MPDAKPTAHQERTSAWRKNERRASALVARETRLQPLSAFKLKNASISLIETSAKERFSSVNHSKNVSTCQHRLRIVTADKPRWLRIKAAKSFTRSAKGMASLSGSSKRPRKRNQGRAFCVNTCLQPSH